jgi:hypothetical protein
MAGDAELPVQLSIQGLFGGSGGPPKDALP